MHACEGGDAVYCVVDAVSLCTGDLRFSYVVDVVVSWCRGVVVMRKEDGKEGVQPTSYLQHRHVFVCMTDERTDTLQNCMHVRSDLSFGTVTRDFLAPRALPSERRSSPPDPVLPRACIADVHSPWESCTCSRTCRSQPAQLTLRVLTSSP
jgi:hypothetical protein